MKSRRKICIVQGAFLPVPPLLGGAVEKMWYLLGHKFAEKGCEVVHISRKWAELPDEQYMHGVVYKRAGGFETPQSGLWLKVLDLFYTLRILRLVPKDSEIIVTNTFWAPILLPMFLKGKVYVDVARMPKGQMRFYRHAARLRANSNPVFEAISSELPAPMAHKISMVPNPLTYEANEQEIVRASNLLGKSNLVLYCGRIHPEKGLELLIEAVNSLPDGWVLKIVGPWEVKDGGGGYHYLQSLKMLFGNRNVQFLDPIYEVSQLNSLYQEAAVFVYPSVAEKGETFGLAPLEAMAWGAVPIVSDLACFKDFIEHKKNGLIFNHRGENAVNELKACMLSLTSDEVSRCQMANFALNVNTSHSPSTIADLFLFDFERCCNEQ